MLNAAGEPQNWLVHGGTFNGEHYSKLDQINLNNTIANLKPARSFEMDSACIQEAESIVIDGVMYVSAAWSHVYAIDAATGKMRPMRLVTSFKLRMSGHYE